MIKDSEIIVIDDIIGLDYQEQIKGGSFKASIR